MLESRKNLKPEKCYSKPQTPKNPLHALLEGFVQDAPIENQNHRHKTDKIIARTLIFSKNQKLQAEIFTRKLDQRTETKFTKTFAEKIKPILKT